MYIYRDIVYDMCIDVHAHLIRRLHGIVLLQSRGSQ